MVCVPFFNGHSFDSFEKRLPEGSEARYWFFFSSFVILTWAAAKANHE